MKLKTEKKGNVSVVECSGKIEIGPGLAKLTGEVDRLLEQGERRFVLNLLAVPWLDSAAIGTIVVTHKHVAERDGKLAIVLNEKSHSIFTVTQLQRSIKTHLDLESALGSLA